MSLPRKVLEKYITPGCLFVETGARWADTSIRAIELGAHFAETCEIDPLLASIAQLHANDATRGNYVRVNNVESIPLLLNYGLEVIDHASTVVYLDAHTETHSPVLGELEAINTWRSKPKAILIDDLRCMKGWGVLIDRLQGKLLDMGYRVSYEDGVEPRDIMVGTK